MLNRFCSQFRVGNLLFRSFTLRSFLLVALYLKSDSLLSLFTKRVTGGNHSRRSLQKERREQIAFIALLKEQ